ncbi:MAG: hypothetical protein ACI909_001268 [Planctomycetota bacterium]|jgi:hypothetical protein
MTELYKIQPTQRIHPPVQDQDVKQKMKKSEHQKKNRKPEQEDRRDGKVDEYI